MSCRWIINGETGRSDNDSYGSSIDSEDDHMNDDVEIVNDDDDGDYAHTKAYGKRQ